MKDVARSAMRRVRGRVFSGLRSARVFDKLSQSEWRRNRLLILCYHGVSLKDEHEWDAQLFVTREFLRRRFEILRNKRYAVLPLGEATRMLRLGTLPARSVVLTFDDGFHNFYQAAVPILEEFQFPATNYVTTYYCIHQRPVLRLIVPYLLWRARSRVLETGFLPGQSDRVDLNDSSQREKLAHRLLSDARVYSEDRQVQRNWLENLADRLGVDWQEMVDSRILHLMTPDQIAEVSRREFDIQLHTHRHRVPRDKAEFVSEIKENRRILEQLTLRAAKHFCYPSGDVDQRFLPWLSELGIETATTCSVALAAAGDEPLLLPRFVDTMAQSEAVFEGWLAGAGEIIRIRRR